MSHCLALQFPDESVYVSQLIAKVDELGQASPWRMALSLNWHATFEIASYIGYSLDVSDCKLFSL